MLGNLILELASKFCTLVLLNGSKNKQNMIEISVIIAIFPEKSEKPDVFDALELY